MIIGTLGAGEVAQAFAIHLLKAGHEVLLSNSRGPSSLTQLVSKLGKSARAVTMDEAAKAPMVLLGVPWPKVEAVLGKLPDWEGRILSSARQIAGLGRPHSYRCHQPLPPSFDGAC
jgi:predicted dinucleotide-binding enzyme